jgi:paired amphipathic helix protein Sin3a
MHHPAGHPPSQSASVPVSQAPPASAPQALAEHDPNFRPLNVKDALSYLDQVKLQFQDQPDVYNQFLDIMKDFKSQA